MADPAAELLVDGLAYGGWKGVEVDLGMEQCAGRFRLGVSERWAGQPVDRAIACGARCALRLDGEPVITGWVDSTRMSVDAGSHTVEVDGRDATGDLVDCSAVRRTGQWRGLRIEQIAAELCAPYGIAVRAEVDTGKPLPSFALQEGESVFEAIERAARIRALLLMSDGVGGLVITRAGGARVSTRLVLGANLLALQVGLDMRDRYSSYTAKGQAPGSDFFNGTAAAQVKATAADASVRRHRPLILTNDCPDVAATLGQRVQWEANMRAARSHEIVARVQGWRHADGLWRPNALVHVEAPLMRLDDVLLISAVRHLLDERGSTTELRMTRADAYTALPMLPSADGGTQGAGAPGSFWMLPRPGS